MDPPPPRYLPSDEGGAFPHTGQAVVPLTALTRQHRRINTTSVVPHTQSKLVVVIAECLGTAMPTSGQTASMVISLLQMLNDLRQIQFGTPPALSLCQC